MTLASLFVKATCLGTILLITHYLITYLQSPLKAIPGPFAAKFTNWWRFFLHYKQTHIETETTLHKKYGDAVRIGPNVISLADPDLIKTIYSTRGTFIKSDYYTINDALQDGHLIQNLFSTRSNAFHAQGLKPVQKLYSFNKALNLEPLMDETISALCSEIDARFVIGENKGKSCDIADWISYFAWDFLGDMTFSKRMGFMEEGRDVQNTIAIAEKVMRYFSVVGQIPILDKFLGKNPYLPYKFPDFSHAAGFCVQQFMTRVQNFEDYKGKNDYMNDFLHAKQEYPDLVSDNEVIGYLILNILGGADTTAIVLKSLIYHILKTPTAKSALLAELKTSNLSSSFPPSYTSLSTLPYLDACIKEGLRIHPVVGHILERVVPSTGLYLPSKGLTLPPGTIVGINPWVVTRNEEVFGKEVEKFRPERWLRGEGEEIGVFEERVRRMGAVDLTFGAGNRTCLGRPLALVELYKVTAALFGKYEIEFEDPKAEWELHKQWFVWPHKIRVKISPRSNQNTNI